MNRHKSRRDFLHALVWSWTGLLVPGRGPAAAELDQLLGMLTEGQTPRFHRAVGLVAPTTAESRLAVPVKVECRLAGTDMIALLVSGNPDPLAARFDLSPRIRPFLRTQVRILKDSQVVAVVRAKGRYYQQRARVSVSQGCD